jgi:putative ABC transport system substrate-binding protein
LRSHADPRPHAQRLESRGRDGTHSETFERAAYFIDKIFKGARPQDLPIEEATNFEFVINTKTLKALGIVLTPTLLARADKLIE